MIKHAFLAYYFDFHGTLCDQLFWESMEAENRAKIDDFLFSRNKHLVKKWMKGQLSYLEISSIISEGTSIPKELIISTLKHDCRNMHFAPRLRSNILRLRETAKISLITGNMDCFSMFAMERLRLHELFDDVIVSADFGVLKTDLGGVLFEIAEARLGVPLSDSCLIDDDVKTGVSFSQLGGFYLRVRNPDDTLSYTDSLMKRNAEN